MDFANVIRDIRQQSLLSQEAFATELGVSFSTVNRWETNKTLPNYQAMKRIEAFCKSNNLNYQIADSLWKERKNGTHTH